LLRYHKMPPKYGPELAAAAVAVLPYAAAVHLVGALAAWSNRDLTRGAPTWASAWLVDLTGGYARAAVEALALTNT
jgi:hypothetical protein